LAYAISYFLPTFTVSDGHLHTHESEPGYSEPGYAAFVGSAFVPFSGLGFSVFGALIAFASWLANPFLWAGVFLFRGRRFALACAAGMIATSLFLPIWIMGIVNHEVDSILVGYYVWGSSILLFTIAATVAWRTWRNQCPATRARGFEVDIEPPIINGDP
jgi:hypothetical protein